MAAAAAAAAAKPVEAPETRALVLELVALLARGLTDAGHAAQIVQNEHRGNCTVRGCTPLCLRYGAALDAARAWLEQQPSELAPAQLPLVEPA